MKRCNACGSRLNDDIMNCPNCGGNNFTAEMVQPMGQQPMNQQYAPGYGTPMGQQPMPGPAVPSANMPMTFATVFMVFAGISALSSLSTLVNEFNISTLIGVVYNVAMIYFLYKRTKVGRILAMIQTILQAILGGLLVLLGILFFVGFSALDLGTTSTGAGVAVGGIFGAVFVIIGIFCLIWGICSFIYFKKRACMYTN